MVKSGRFTLEECAPYKVVKYVPVNGKLKPQETIVMAHKILLIEIRKRLLEKQRKYRILWLISACAYNGKRNGSMGLIKDMRL